MITRLMAIYMQHFSWKSLYDIVVLTAYSWELTGNEYTYVYVPLSVSQHSGIHSETSISVISCGMVAD
jgi:hypothetical protein